MTTVLHEMDCLLKKLGDDVNELGRGFDLPQEERKIRILNIKINAEKLSYYNDLISIDPDISTEIKERRKTIIDKLIAVIDLIYNIEELL